MGFFCIYIKIKAIVRRWKAIVRRMKAIIKRWKAIIKSQSLAFLYSLSTLLHEPFRSAGGTANAHCAYVWRKP